MMHLYSAGRADHLAARLAGVLAEAPLDPMETEWVGVSSQGMRRWLLLELARHLGAASPAAGDGVAANFSLPLPSALRVQVLAAHRAEDDPDPWAIERLVWSVLSTAMANESDPVLQAFNELPPGASRYGKARRVADQIDRYHVHRPHMILQWAAGHDVGGLGRPLPAHHAWQPHLWRLIRQRLGAPSPPERLPDLLAELRAGHLTLELPRRITLFGLTSLPGGRSLLELTEALAVGREVHLFLLEPTRFDGAELAVRTSPLAGDAERNRSEDTSALAALHPLLRSWGRPHREASLLLFDALGPDAARPEFVDVPGRPEPTGTVLARIQQEIAANQEPSGSLRIDASDRSLQFHACHGATRQVEVLRDAILHLLAKPDLDVVEDDILIICPALERFAPLVEAVFGPSADTSAAARDPSGPPLLRYRIADRSVSEANPMLHAMTTLVELVSGRFEATSVQDFISLAPVRHRFGFDDDDIGTISEWVVSAEVRWGLTPEHREGFGVPATISTNTWRAALDRLLLGSAISDDDGGLSVGDVSVLGVEGGAVETLGRLAELLWRLTELVHECRREHSVGEWVTLLRRYAGELFSTPSEFTWQGQALSVALADISDSAAGDVTSSRVQLSLVDLRRILADRLREAPGRPDFFRGGVTLTTLKPLRGIPYRVICLLGADESALVAGGADGDDLVALAPVVGDPDGRSDDRQALLEAVMATGDTFIVVRDGHDVRTNQEIPRAVVLEELRDVILATVHSEDRAELAKRLEVAHPRQAFDERCFMVGELTPRVPWSFSHRDLEGARARGHRTEEVAPFMNVPLASHPESVVELSTLQEFFKDPVAWFVLRRLGARLPRAENPRGVQLPVAPTPLERWKLGDGLLAARRGGSTNDEWSRIERQRGTLPPGSLGEEMIDDFSATVDDLVGAAQKVGIANGPVTVVPIDVVLPHGTRIVGSVHSQLAPPRHGSARITYSYPKLEHQVAAWLDLMALVANDPAVDWQSLVVSRYKPAAGSVRVLEITPKDKGDGVLATATTALEVVLALFRQGCNEPIPLFPKLSERIHAGGHKASHWTDDHGSPERSNPATALVYGEYEFDELMSLPARDGDPAGEGGRVQRFADTMFETMETSASHHEELC